MSESNFPRIECPAIASGEATISGVRDGFLILALNRAAGPLSGFCTMCRHTPGNGGDCEVISNGTYALGGKPQYMMNWPDPMAEFVYDETPSGEYKG